MTTAARTIDCASLAPRVEAWFHANRRDLPWRTEPRDPYFALVSEVMCQQTQAPRVAVRFVQFIERFPSVDALAAASEDDVLAAWSGLGYYRRAKHLHAAARAIVDRHDGAFPRTAADLRSLPGVGRYTAGAIASMCFRERTPLVDANVVRVALRLNGRALAPSDPDAVSLAWSFAASLVEACDDPAALNEGLMELGAVVCAPRGPQCLVCPLRDCCAAAREGRQDEIPAKKAAKPRPVVHHAAVVIHDNEGRLLVEQRPPRGLWASMFQAPTLETAGDRPPSAREVARALGLKHVEPLTAFIWKTTHREVRFAVYRGVAARAIDSRRLWLSPDEVASLALATPHRRILLKIAEDADLPEKTDCPARRRC